MFLGKTEINKSTVHEIYVENISNRIISIKLFAGGCKCTHIKDKPTIAPGETIKLEINFAPRSLGKSKDKIIIVTDDPAHPLYELLVNSNGVDSLTIPKGIMLDQRNTGFGF